MVNLSRDISLSAEFLLPASRRFGGRDSLAKSFGPRLDRQSCASGAFFFRHLGARDSLQQLLVVRPRFQLRTAPARAVWLRIPTLRSPLRQVFRSCVVEYRRQLCRSFVVERSPQFASRNLCSQQSFQADAPVSAIRLKLPIRFAPDRNRSPELDSFSRRRNYCSSGGNLPTRFLIFSA